MLLKTVSAAIFSTFTLSALAWADTPDFSKSTAETPPMPAPAAQPKLRWIFDVGYMTGGDKLVDVDVYNDLWDSSSTEDVRAGQGFWLLGGAELPLAPSWALQARFGYLFDSIEAKNASFSFDRFPVELLPLYTVNQIQFGLGLTYHLNPEFDPDLGLGKVKFKNALGMVAEINYVWTERARVGLHFTQIDYKVKSVESGYEVSKSSVNGTGAGIHLTAAF